MKEKYIELLRSTKRSGIENLIKWLNTTDFFTAPASTRFHLSRKHGLLEHSLNVYKELVDIWANESRDLPRYDSDNLIIVSLLHDVCKANFYSISEKNVKKDNKWVKEPYYMVDDKFPIGHGEKSVILIQRYIKLTAEEIVAIRWHMGAYESKENYNSLSIAFNNYPLALMLHMADLKATYWEEGEGKWK